MVERVQCSATHWVTGEHQSVASVTEMLGKLGWETLEVRWSKIRLAMFYILNNLIAIQTTQLIIKTNSTRRKKHALIILQLQIKVFQAP